MSKNIFALMSLIFLFVWHSKGQVLIGPYIGIGDIQRQGDLEKVIAQKPNIKQICFYSDVLHKFEYLDTISNKRFWVYDSVPYISDSIILLKKLEKLSITGNKFIYISPNLSKLKRLKYFDINNFGRKEKMRTDIPMLPYVKYAVISSSDSAIVKNTLKSIPNVQKIELHFEAQSKAQSQWNAYNILENAPNLKTLVIPYWYGLEYASRKKLVYADEIDTTYEEVYYLDLNLRHCKHLHKIVTDFELSPEMQRYCRRHWIRVVKFSRWPVWKKIKFRIEQKKKEKYYRNLKYPN